MLPVIACIIAPVSAKPPPTAMAAIILGSLTFHTMLFRLISSKTPEKKWYLYTSITSLNPKSAEPKNVDRGMDIIINISITKETFL